MQYFYWSIPVLSFVAQFLFILNSQTQIRYEELAEAVRNVFWLQNGLIYDGVSSNVGWYGILLGIYNLFGFHLFAAQYFRLLLHLVSMVCLGLVLKRYLGYKGWLPYLVISLSPTLLYFNTLEASYGIDLQYFPIVLWLILGGLGLPAMLRKALQAGGWMLAMIAWMSYPTFIFYLPVLVLLSYLSHLRSLRYLILAAISFLVPLALAFALIENRSLLLFDPSVGSGIFRGAGKLSFDFFSQNLAGLFNDLFDKGQSYHFDLFSGEFSLIFPILTVITVLVLSFKKGSWGVWGIGGLLGVLILASLTADPSGEPGIRRYTPVLAVFYGLFALAWNYLMDPDRHRDDKWKVGIVVMSLLAVHHLIVFPINLSHLKDPSPDAYPIWFDSLPAYVETVQKEDLNLRCLAADGQLLYCRLSEIYAAVAGSCIWNDLDCYSILGLDSNTGKQIPLNIELWQSGYFEH